MSMVNTGRSHTYHLLPKCLLHIYQGKKVFGSSVFETLFFLKPFVFEVSSLKNITRKFTP